MINIIQELNAIAQRINNAVNLKALQFLQKRANIIMKKVHLNEYSKEIKSQIFHKYKLITNKIKKSKKHLNE